MKFFKNLKELYFGSLDEARGTIKIGVGAKAKVDKAKADAEKEEVEEEERLRHVIPDAKTAVMGVMALEGSPQMLGNSGNLFGYRSGGVAQSAETTGTTEDIKLERVEVPDSEGNYGSLPKQDAPKQDAGYSIYLNHPAFIGGTGKTIMFISNGEWKVDTNKIDGNWKVVLQEFAAPVLPPAQQTAADQLEKGGHTPYVPQKDQDPIARAGDYIGQVKPFENEETRKRLTEFLANIATNIIKRAEDFRAEKGYEENDENCPAWARSRQMAGGRATGGSNAGWEWHLAHCTGIKWEKVDGKPIVIEDPESITEDILLDATESKDFFEEAALGQKLPKDVCKEMQDRVKIRESVIKREGKEDKKVTRIAFVKGDSGIVKNASAPELEAIKKIKAHCECDTDNKVEGCIEKGKSPFGDIPKAYSQGAINAYVGTMTETLRVCGQLLREMDRTDDSKRRRMIMGHVTTTMDAAIADDHVLHEEGMKRLRKFNEAGTKAGPGGFMEIQTIEAIEKLGTREELTNILLVLERNDLQSRDPDMVFPVGKITGDGRRDDNLEVHLDRRSLETALLNIGLTEDDFNEFIHESTLASISDPEGDYQADKKWTDLYSEVHDISPDTKVFVMGLSLKNQLIDSSSKFGEQTRQAQSEMLLLKEGEGTIGQRLFREKAKKELGLDEKDLEAIRLLQGEHDAIKDLVYGLFSSPQWTIKALDGTASVKEAGAIADSLMGQIKGVLSEDSELKKDLVEALDELVKNPKNEKALGVVREKLTRAFTAQKTHKECNKRNKNKELTAQAKIARKHLALSVFYCGGTVRETLVSKRGLVSGKVKLYSQNTALLPACKGILAWGKDENGKPLETWDVGDSGYTTKLIKPSDKRSISFSRTGDGKGLDKKSRTGKLISGGRHTRYEVEVSESYLESGDHFLKPKDNLHTIKPGDFEVGVESTSYILNNLMKTQQQLFEKLLLRAK